MNRLLTILAIIIFNLNCISVTFAQQMDSTMLSGIVLNDAKEPISQVTLNIPGSKPVYTGEDGTFKI